MVMKRFPIDISKNTSKYAISYFSEISKIHKKLDVQKIDEITNILIKCYKDRKNLFVCGNGGSSAISNHFVCDHQKGVGSDTTLLPKIISLSANIEIITAIANDIEFDEIYTYQLSRLANKGDCLLTVSSSGNSKNIISAIKWANNNNLKTISLNGFSGGKANKLSNISLNVPSKNYGIVEDIHQSIMHIMAQSIKMKFLKISNTDNLVF